jgi:hypothetical protein
MPLGVDLVDADPPHHARAQRRDDVGGSSGTQRPEGPASPPPAMEHRAAGHANGNATAQTILLVRIAVRACGLTLTQMSPLRHVA